MDRRRIFLIVFSIVLAAVASSVVSYTIGHQDGYISGAYNTRIYHEATNEFPSEIWLQATEAKDFNSFEEIYRTLLPYGGF